MFMYIMKMEKKEQKLWRKKKAKGNKDKTREKQDNYCWGKSRSQY